MFYINASQNNKLHLPNRPDKEENNVNAVQLNIYCCKIYAVGGNMDSRRWWCKFWLKVSIRLVWLQGVEGQLLVAVNRYYSSHRVGIDYNTK